MHNTLRNLLIGTLVSVLAGATSLGAPAHHKTTAGRTEATASHKMTSPATNSHKATKSAKKHAVKKSTAKKHKAARKNNGKTKKMHAQKSHKTAKKAAHKK